MKKVDEVVIGINKWVKNELIREELPKVALLYRRYSHIIFEIKELTDDTIRIYTTQHRGFAGDPASAEILELRTRELFGRYFSKHKIEVEVEPYDPTNIAQNRRSRLDVQETIIALSNPRAHNLLRAARMSDCDWYKEDSNPLNKHDFSTVLILARHILKKCRRTLKAKDFEEPIYRYLCNEIRYDSGRLIGCENSPTQWQVEELTGRDLPAMAEKGVIALMDEATFSRSCDLLAFFYCSDSEPIQRRIGDYIQAEVLAGRLTAYTIDSIRMSVAPETPLRQFADDNLELYEAEKREGEYYLRLGQQLGL